ncbi:MAG TPA: SRPBCC family protein [Thermoanaerobaculia bacterium]|nr:SRPBCC family protein [Thermoanaerobaculia bacterium]
MKIALIVIGSLVVAVSIVVLIGARLPRNHVAARERRFDSPPAAVYAAIRDVASYATWRGDVQRVELLSATRFREHGKNGAVTYDVVEDVPGRKLVTRIADLDLGYSGSWTYELAPEGTGTLLRITENGEVSNPLFRFMSRYVFGQTATMDAYLAALGKHVP